VTLRDSQHGAEALFSVVPPATRESQAGVELLHRIVPPLTRFTQAGIEMLYGVPKSALPWLQIDLTPIDVQFVDAFEDPPTTIGKPTETADNGMLSTQRGIRRHFRFTTGALDDDAIDLLYSFNAGSHTIKGHAFGTDIFLGRVEVQSAPFLPLGPLAHFRTATITIDELLPLGTIMPAPTTVFGWESFASVNGGNPQPAYDSHYKGYLANSIYPGVYDQGGGRNGGSSFRGAGFIAIPVPVTDSVGAATDPLRGQLFGYNRNSSAVLAHIASFGEHILGVYDTFHVTIAIGPAGDIRAYRCGWNNDYSFSTPIPEANAVLLGSSLDPGQSGITVPFTGYVHYEANVRVHNTLGSVQVFVNEILALDLSGVDTRNNVSGRTGTGEISFVAVHPKVSNTDRICDWAWHSGDGTLGDCGTAYAPSAAAGAYTAGTPVGAGTILDCVKEQSWDGDSKYIEFDATGLPKAASFKCTFVPSNALAIIGVSALVSVRKDAAGTDLGRAFLRSNSGGGATEVDDGADPIITTSYRYLGAGGFHLVDPDTGVAFLISDITGGNIEVGFRRTA
jgi:hypothetical protein